MQGFLTDFISLQVSAKLQLKNGMLMEWGTSFSQKWIQIWVCFSGQCYCYYTCAYNSLKQGFSISSSYPIYLCCSYSHRPNELESHLQHLFKANCKVGLCHGSPIQFVLFCQLLALNRFGTKKLLKLTKSEIRDKRLVS